MQKQNKYISTPFYRQIVDTPITGCVDEPSFKYSSYDIFVMYSRLTPYIYKILESRKPVIYFEGVKENNKMSIKILLKDIEKDLIICLSDREHKLIQDKVNEIVSVDPDYTLIDRTELYISSRGSVHKDKGDKYLDTVTKYPYSWFNSMLQYVNLDSSYNPFITQDGIYLAFNPLSDFSEAYFEVIDHILNIIDKFWQEGVVYSKDLDKNGLAVKWGLEYLDLGQPVHKLYKPVWKDKRITGKCPVNFLLRVLSGDNFIYVNISNNLVRRHYVATMLNNNNVEFTIDGSRIKYLSQDIFEAQMIASIIDSGNNLAEGKVMLYTFDRPSWLYLYTKASKKYLNISDASITTYQTTDTVTPYVFSCLLSNKNVDSKSSLDFLREKVLEQLIEMKATLAPNVSPHDVIELNIINNSSI